MRPWRHPPLRAALALLTLALLAAVPALRATTLIAPDFDKLVNTSDCVVRATVKSVTSEWRDNPDRPGSRYIASRVELNVLEVIAGSPPSPLVLEVAGGRVGDTELVVDGAPHFEVGRESILFVQGNGRQLVPLTGMRHGHYPVRRDKLTGRDQVMRSSGQLLYSEQEVALPESALSPVPARDPQARPLTSGEFASRIRQALKTRNHEALR
jgi:hypothetical protein